MHATTCERHHELLRDQLHRMLTQQLAEGIQIAFKETLSAAVYAKNALLTYGGFTPMEAATGVRPSLLPDQETPGISLTADSTEGPSRFASRVRELAVIAMIQATAQARIKLASATQARATAQQLSLQPGDQVDVFRAPSSKDLTGWRGPAIVASTANLDDGHVEVTWQGRLLSVRIADLRRSLAFALLLDDESLALNVVRQHARTITGQATFGFVYSNTGWTLTQAAKDNMPVLFALLRTASDHFSLSNCVGARIGREVAVLTGLASVSTMLLWFWPVAHPEMFRTLSGHGAQKLQFSQVFGSNWADYAWVQFMMVNTSDAQYIQQLAPEMPNLGAPPAPPDNPMNPPDDHMQPQPPDEPQNDDDYDFNDAMTLASTTVLPSPMTTTPGQPPPMPPPSQPPRPRERNPWPGNVWTRQPASTQRSRTPVHTASAASTIDYPGPSPPGSAASTLPYPGPNSTASAASTIPVPISSSQVVKLPVASDASRGSRSERRQARAEEKAQEKASSSKDVRSKSSKRDAPETPVRSGGPRKSQALSPLSTVSSPGTLPEGFYPPDSTSAAAASAHEETVESEHEQTSENEADEFFVLPHAHVTAPWSYYGDFQSLLKDQEAYLASSSEGPGATLLGPASVHAEFEISFADRKHYFGLPTIAADELIVLVAVKGQKPQVLIEKSLDALSPSDMKVHWKLVQTAILAELNSFIQHKVFCRVPKKGAQNICTSRWVMRWKLINNERAVKARLTIRGFQDQREVDTYAGTASRWSQRIVCSIAVQHSWAIWITDVATAFLQSDSFEQLAQEAGTELKTVCFTPPAGSESTFRLLKAYEDIDFSTEVLHLLRPAYGLKDAPKAWKTRLNKLLLKIGARVCPTDSSL